VVGLEQEERFVTMARAEVAQRGLSNVEVVQGDALNTRLLKSTFDLVHERLVMINVPTREAGNDLFVAPRRDHHFGGC